MESSEEITPFNWHEANKESFLAWAIVVMLSSHKSETSTRVLEVLDRSQGGHDLRVTLDVNGVVFDAVPFFERLWQEMEHQAKAHAAEMVEDELVKLTHARESIDAVLDLAASNVRRHFKDIGLPMQEDEWR